MATVASYCWSCGNPTSPAAELCVKCGVRLSSSTALVATGSSGSSKSRLAAALLAFFLGGFGAHRFYLGNTGSAVAMLIVTILGIVTAFAVIGFFLLFATGVWALIDLIMILVGVAKDGRGKTVVTW